MSQLSSLFASHGSDKDRNGYSSLYNALFLPLKDAPVTLLEVGVGTMIPGAHSSMKGYMPDSYQPGASLRAWRDFFQNGEIHGVDVAPRLPVLGAAHHHAPLRLHGPRRLLCLGPAALL